MAISESDLARAEKRLADLRSRTPVVASAHYDARRKIVEVHLDNGMMLAFPPAVVEGLADAPVSSLRPIEIDAGGLALRWPKLDLDLYLPSLLQGTTGSRAWMAAQLGAKGGSATSKAKRAAAQRNGRLGGRPRSKKAA
jgi:hypothetical protein